MIKTDFDAWIEMFDAQGILYEIILDEELDSVVVYPKQPSTGCEADGIYFDKDTGLFECILTH